MRALGPLLALVVVVVLLISSALYTVDQRQNAIVFQLGEVKEVVQKPAEPPPAGEPGPRSRDTLRNRDRADR